MILAQARLIIILTLYILSAWADTDKSLAQEDAGKSVLDYILGNGPKFCKCLCGRANRPSAPRILGGQYTEAHEYPWLAVVNIQSITASTGTLLNDRYVLTAASQVLGLTPYDVKVTLGAHNRCYPDVTSSNHSVSNILIHPEYDPLTRSNDLALLKLSNTVTTDRWISPVCLPQPDTNYQGAVAEAISWGQGPTEEIETVSTCRPRKIGLPINNDRDCLTASSIPGAVTSDKACAGTLGAQTIVCSTDAGGPILYKGLDGLYELIGILTDSNVCASSTSGPAIFTKVNSHFSWIFQSTRDSCYCAK